MKTYSGRQIIRENQDNEKTNIRRGSQRPISKTSTFRKCWSRAEKREQVYDAGGMQLVTAIIKTNF